MRSQPSGRWPACDPPSASGPVLRRARRCRTSSGLVQFGAFLRPREQRHRTIVVIRFRGFHPLRARVILVIQMCFVHGDRPDRDCTGHLTTVEADLLQRLLSGMSSGLACPDDQNNLLGRVDQVHCIVRHEHRGRIDQDVDTVLAGRSDQLLCDGVAPDLESRGTPRGSNPQPIPLRLVDDLRQLRPVHRHLHPRGDAARPGTPRSRSIFGRR